MGLMANDFLHKILRFALPKSIWSQDTASLRPTAWLDGLRGFAAIIVVFNHTINIQFARAFQGYHSEPVESNNLFIQLPIFRVFFGYHAMVSIFFGISGYCLSYKPVRLVKSNRLDELVLSLSNSLFRRVHHLYIPAIIVAVVCQVFAYLGWFGYTDFGTTPGALPGHKDSILTHLYFLWSYIIKFINPLDGPGAVGYNVQFWTLPMEFRASISVYLTQLALVNVQRVCRLPIIFTLGVYFLFQGLFQEALFLGGFFLAEMGCNREVPDWMSEKKSPDITIKPKYRNSSLDKSRHYFMFAVAYYFLFVPSNYAFTPGYKFLYNTFQWRYGSIYDVPRFWHVPSVTLLLYSMEKLPSLQRIFNTSAMQFFGRISYSMYLVHMFLLNFGHQKVYNLFASCLGDQSLVGFWATWICTGLVNFWVLIWVSYFFYVHVDAKTGSMTKWALKK